jgi:hypothetical protein
MLYPGSLPSSRGLLIFIAVRVRDGSDGIMALLYFGDEQDQEDGYVRSPKKKTAPPERTNLKNLLLSFIQTHPVFIAFVHPSPVI